MCQHDISVEMPFFCDLHDCYELRQIDACIAPLVYKLNKNGIRTTNSCCGHGQYQGSIVIEPADVDRAIELGYTVKEECNGDFSIMEILI